MKKRFHTLPNYCVIVLLVLCLQSCSIHFKFPFICFEKECVWKLYKIREIKTAFKTVKANRTKRKKKRNIKRGRFDFNDKTVKKDSEQNTEDKRQKHDSLKTDSIPIAENMRIVLNRSNSIHDTVIVLKSFTKSDSLVQTDIVFLEQYFKKQKRNGKFIILIQESNHKNRTKALSTRLSHLKNYLKTLNIDREILIKTSKHISDSNIEEKIELRILPDQ